MTKQDALLIAADLVDLRHGLEDLEKRVRDMAEKMPDPKPRTLRVKPRSPRVGDPAELERIMKRIGVAS